MGQAEGVASTASGRLPVVVYLPGDLSARDSLTDTNGFARVPLDRSPAIPHSGFVLLISSENLLAEHWEELRGYDCLQLVALSDEPFSDPQMDGAVYAYVPRNTRPELVERTVENAFDHIHLTNMRQEFNRRLAEAWKEIDELNRIGAALSAEQDKAQLLDTILTKSREITGADAGSLYLVEDGETPQAPRRLRFALAQNDSVAINFKATTIEISPRSIAGHVAMTGETVNIEDAYQLPEGAPYAVNRKFDEDSGYRTRSILALPLCDQQGEIVGVVQLINSKRDHAAKLDKPSAVEEYVVPFALRHRDLAASLASQAAVALENSRLVESIRRLFEGFVSAAVGAIEARDPTTSGHSFRVSHLTMALAEAVNRAQSGPLADVHFTAGQLRELRYASLLHDFGKVGVREEVLVKARKLYPRQLELAGERFEMAKRTAEVETLREALRFALEQGCDAYRERASEFEAQLARRCSELDRWWETVREMNLPTVLPEGNFEQLNAIASYSYTNSKGERIPLLTPEEVHLLSIRRGSLDDAERQQMESHVVHTEQFLSQIPWTREISGVVPIARAHHEKLNGHGYPRRLRAADIPIQSRMMAIADIFDGLTAADRPYKRAVSVERALEILQMEVDNGDLDPDLVRLFIDDKIYEQAKADAT